MNILTKSVPISRQNPLRAIAIMLASASAGFTVAINIVKLLHYNESKRIEAGDFTEGSWMLTIFGSRETSSFCDRIGRRDFIRIGGLSMGGLMSLSLADLFRAEARAGSRSSHKAVINIFLGGGPPHQDMWEIKTEAPAEIRGEFKPIATKVPGIDICEVFPQLAGLMDKAVVIRSVIGAADRHEAFQCNTGWHSDSLQSIGGRPSMGAMVSKLQGAVDPAIPPFVGLAARTQHVPWSDPGSFGFLGPAYAPFQPDGPAMANMKLRIPDGSARRSSQAPGELRRAEARARCQRFARRSRLGDRAGIRRPYLEPLDRGPGSGT